MGKPKKEFHPFSIRMDLEIYKRLNNYCLESGQTKTTAIERAVKQYIDDYDEKIKQLKELNRK